MMNKLTQIVNVLHTASFIVDSNKDGKKIDYNDPGLFRIIPSQDLAGSMLSLGGQVRIQSFNTQLWLPFGYDAGNVDHTVVDRLPADLIFYIECLHPEWFPYTGLPLSGNKLFLIPGGNSLDYQFYGRTITCQPCGSAAVITQADSVPVIHPDISMDEISRLITSPVGSADQVIDLKITIEGIECIVTRDHDMKRFRQLLQGFADKPVGIDFRRNSDNSQIKNFPRILVLQERLHPHVIGLFKIARSALDLSKTDAGTFLAVNNYIIHFPGIKPDVTFEITTKLFSAGDKLFLDEEEVQAPVVQDHPVMPGYKLLKSTVNNYELFLRKSKKVSIHKGDKSIDMPIDPLRTYNSQLNKSKIVITK